MTLLDVHVGRALTLGRLGLPGLSLFPVWDSRAVADAGYAVHSPHVSVAECPQPVVPRLVATNAGDLPALLLDGERLDGGRQTRMLVGSRLLPAHSRRLVPVRCLEVSRWSGDGSLARDGRRATSRVRAVREQGEVWARVAREETRLGRSGATRSLSDATADVEVVARGVAAGLRPLPGQCGLLVGVGGQPLALEVLDAPDAFAQVFTDLVVAAVVDAAGAPAVPTPGRRARRFLDRVCRVPLQRRPAGAVDGTSDDVTVRALRWQHRTLHTSALFRRHPLLSGA